jgi:hypothetical protein
LIEKMRLSKLTRLALPPAVAVCAYLWCFRPWYLRWGASDEESRAALPGPLVHAAAGRYGREHLDG